MENELEQNDTLPVNQDGEEEMPARIAGVIAPHGERGEEWGEPDKRLRLDNPSLLELFLA